MDPARPLRDVLADLVGDESARQAHAADPGGYLAAAGHPDLPGDLVSEAIVSYAGTAPAEVAEHVAPFVMAHSPVPVEGDVSAELLDPSHGLELLSTAATEPVLDDLTVDAHAAADLAGPDTVHNIAGHDIAGHDIAGHDLAGHDLAGHDLAGHDVTGHDLLGEFVGHESVGGELAEHDVAGHDLAGEFGGHEMGHEIADGITDLGSPGAHPGDLADPFGLDFGHGDPASAGEVVHTGHLDPAGLEPVEHPDDLQPGEHDTAGGPDWFAGADEVAAPSHVDHPQLPGGDDSETGGAEHDAGHAPDH